MTDTRLYVKLHEGFADHPKVAQAGPEAGWLYIAGLCYSGRHITDGQIPKAIVRTLTSLKRPKLAAKALVSVGLWDEDEANYYIHDYLEHQRSSAEIEELRSKRQEAGRRGGQSKGQANAKASASARLSVGYERGASKTQPETETETETDLKNNIANDSKMVVPIRPGVPAQRARDEIWDALMYVCRIDTSAIPSSTRLGYNKVASELRGLNATAEEITRRATAYRLTWPEASLTPHALLKQWAQVEGAATQPKISPNELEINSWIAGGK